MLYYAGIGSRKSPDDILVLMEKLAKILAQDGWILRSGHASGADQAFERGARYRAQIFLPWPSFESAVPIDASYVMEKPTLEAAEIASRYHPNWEQLGKGARSLHARNAHQIFGPDVSMGPKSQCVICWTQNGSLSGIEPDTGGTGQALRIATAHEITVLNLARIEHREMAEEKVKSNV